MGAGENDDEPRLVVRAVQVNGPLPVADVHVDLSPGVTAFYGLNGAGKSRLLRAMADLLSGTPHGDGYLICRRSSTTARKGSGLAFDEAVHDLGAQLGLPTADTLDVSEMVAVALQEMWAVPVQAAQRWASVVASQRHWLLQPVQSLPGRYWSTPGFVLDELHPEIADVAGAALEHWRGLTSQLGSASAAIDALDPKVLDHPLLLAGPLASAYAEGDAARMSAEMERLSRCHAEPYPLFDFDWDLRPLPRESLELSQVVTDNDLGPAGIDAHTVDLVVGRLTDLADEPNADSVELRNGLRRLRVGLDGGEPTQGSLVLRHVAAELSATASDIIASAMPRQLSLHCELMDVVEWFDGPPLSWRARDAAGLSLAVGELSSAQVRWACLAIALAIRRSRRDADLQDLRRRVAGQLESWRTDAEAEARERYEEAIASLELEISDVKDMMELRDGRSGDTKDDSPRDVPDDLEPDFEDLYAADDSVLWGGEDLAGELEALQRELEELRADPDRVVPVVEGPPSDEEIDELLSGHSPAPLFVFIDEPEAGLHRSAEKQVAELLVRLSAAQDATVLVATHSPEFLRNSDIRKVVVDRKPPARLTTIDRKPRVVFDTARSLGLRPHEALHLYRVILLVEGRHDELLLTTLLGDELDEMGVLVLPLHGGKWMATAADSHLLAQFTDQPVVAMVDNVRQVMFERLVEVGRSVRPGDSEEYVRRSAEVVADRKADEVGFIAKLMRRAFDLGHLDRFSPYGLSRRDVLEYLPVHAFVDGAGSWDELHADFAQQSKVRPFKQWAKQKRGASFDDATIVRACAQLDSVPAEFVDLLRHLKATASENPEGRSSRGA